jgi:hypothetical protein
MCIQNQGLRNLLLFSALFYLVGTETCYAQGKPDEIKTLLKERRDLLSEVSSIMAKAFLEGRVDMQILVQAERDSLRADLDWFDRADDRIQAINKHKKIADKILEVAETEEKVGKIGRTDVLRVRAYVLEVQIELHKEKRKAK